jgi:antitoxin (DNA-binding transcriptional repressor) of toxin-antitoxin stability system
MLTATFTEFRQHAKTYFDQVEKGESIHIIRHGKIIAEVKPATHQKHILSWKKSGLQMVVKGLSLSKEILKDRERGK